MLQTITSVMYWVLFAMGLTTLVVYSYLASDMGKTQKRTISAILALITINLLVLLHNTTDWGIVTNIFAPATNASSAGLTPKIINISGSIALLLISSLWWLPKELKKQKNKLKEGQINENYFRTITERSSDIILMLTLGKGITYTSPAITQVTGYEPADLKGRMPELFIHTDYIKIVKNVIEKAKSSPNKTIAIPDFRLRTTSGDWKYMEGLATYIIHEEKPQIILNWRDISNRKEATNSLTYRLEMDKVLSKISTEFINNAGGEIKTSLLNALKSTGKFLGTDRSYIYELNLESGTMNRKHMWEAVTEDKHPDKFINFALNDFPWLMDNLSSLKSITINNLNEIPEIATPERLILQQSKIKSLLFVPLSVRGELTGFIGIDTTNKEKQWQKTDLTMMSILAETLAGALDRHKAEETFHTLSQAVEQSPASVVITDKEGNIEYVNSKFEEVSGYALSEVIGQNPRIIKSNKNSAELYKNLWAAITSGHPWQGEMYNKKKDGTLFWEHVSISPIRNKNNEITHFLGIKEDITQRKEYEDRIVQQANYDELTGLPNRTLTHDRLSESLVRARRNNSNVAVLYIGLDGFKKINETLGHAIGDDLLKQVGERLLSHMGETDTVSRFGGDEFLIIHPYQGAAIHTETIASELLNSLEEAFTIKENEIQLTASMGIAVYPNDAKAPQEIIRNAGSAMQQAKDSGRNNFQFFTPEMHSKALARREMENLLRHALEKNELELFYQPIVNANSQRPIGAEALLRWNCEELGGLVMPGDFIPLSEDTGLIVPIGDWVLIEACKQAAQWQGNLKMPQFVTVNVSPRQFQGNDVVKSVASALKESGLPAHRLKIEVTESLLIGDVASIEETLNKIKELGVLISLDDFGTGYSSLSYLKRFPFDNLKIDRSFVMDIPEDSDDMELVKAIIAMAKSLNLEIIAEGVETKEQLEFLKEQHCQMIQGFYYSKPLPVDKFNDKMANWEFG